MFQTVVEEIKPASPRSRLLILPALAMALLISACALTSSAPQAADTLSLLSGTKPPRPTQPAPRVAAAYLPTQTQQYEPASFALTPTPLVLPDYPVPSPTGLPPVDPGEPRPDDSGVNRLIIPRMGLDAVVKYVPFTSSTWLIGGLKWEIAWMGDTSWPGLGGNTALAAHVDFSDGSAGPFWNLAELQPGDSIQVYTERNRYTYRVREQITVPDTDLSVIAPTDNPQITLITCAGWDSGLHTYLMRLIVYADLVEIAPLVQAN